jgi:competence protein ComEA
MRKTLFRALGALGIAAALVLAAPSALSSSKKTPTPSADTAASKEKTADKAKTEKVNLNTADEKDIAAAKGVGDKLAKELVKNRPYKTWEDVSKVKGVGTGKKLDSLKKVLKLSDGVAAKEEPAAKETKEKKSKSSSKGDAAAAPAAAGAAAGGAAAGGASATTSKASSDSSTSKKSPSSSSSEKAAAPKLAPGEKVNINTASAEELDKLPEIGPVKAQAIVDYRKANGKFSSIEDVMKVSGIKEGTFAKIKDYIVVR